VKLIRRVSLGLREGNSDKVYIVDLCEVSNKKFVVNFQFGRRGQPLKDGTKTDNPVAEPVARSIFAKLVDEKTRKGYRETTLAAAAAAAGPATPAPPPARRRGNASREEAVLARLRGENSSFRRAWSLERVAWRAGEMRLKAAVPLLIDKLGSGSDLLDYCLAWALARCGDETTFAAACTARRKPGLKPADAVAVRLGSSSPRPASPTPSSAWPSRCCARGARTSRPPWPPAPSRPCPPGLRHVGRGRPCRGVHRGPPAHPRRRRVTRRARPPLPHRLAVVRPGLLAALRTVPFTPGPFRSVRHIYKLAESRGDVEIFGLLAHRIEKTPHNFAARRGTYIDGRWTDVGKELKKADSRLAYGERTRNYLRNRSWLSLQRVGSLGDAGSYVRAAVGVLLPFTDADGHEPRSMSRYDYSSRKTKTTHWDRFAPYLAFNHILHGNGGRYELKGRTRTWRCAGKYKPGDPAPDQREEMFPALWDQVPVGLLHLLAESQCAPVHVFASGPCAPTRSSATSSTSRRSPCCSGAPTRSPPASATTSRSPATTRTTPTSTSSPPSPTRRSTRPARWPAAASTPTARCSPGPAT
jgi:predicted DNA-binding WGR domain protein